MTCAETNYEGSLGLDSCGAKIRRDLAVDVIGAGESQLWLVVAHLLRKEDSQLIKGGTQLLHNVGPDLRFLGSTLDLNSLQNSGGKREVVDPPAGSQGGGDDGGLGYQVHSAEIAHALSDLPAIDICSVEVGNVPRVKLGIGFERGAHKSHRGRNLAWTHLHGGPSEGGRPTSS